jgi:hypothetical protein
LPSPPLCLKYPRSSPTSESFLKKAYCPELKFFFAAKQQSRAT